jgi:hypothetical protein
MIYHKLIKRNVCHVSELVMHCHGDMKEVHFHEQDGKECVPQYKAQNYQ